MWSMDVATADLIDAHGDRLRSCELQLRQYGAKSRFFGRVRTLKTFEDNALLKDTVASAGDGAVLVVDGAGSLRCALVGDVLAGLAVRSGWAGLIIHGAIRDSAAIARLPIGVKALGTNPRKSGKTGHGSLDVAVSFGGIEFRPGDWLYSDEDGIVVSTERLSI